MWPQYKTAVSSYLITCRTPYDANVIPNHYNSERFHVATMYM